MAEGACMVAGVRGRGACVAGGMRGGGGGGECMARSMSGRIILECILVLEYFLLVVVYDTRKSLEKSILTDHVE